MMDCLDDNTVNAYIERVLPTAVRAQVAAHLDHCEACPRLTGAAVRSTGELAATVPDATADPSAPPPR
ncbi:MAG: zf-HC2 domain-containing protein, partial [Myxococcales bacterium]|nr:zf-HC2 domain-containing protein [Myxococcales bacterium]